MRILLISAFTILISISGNCQKKNNLSIEFNLVNQATDSLFIWGITNGHLDIVRAIKLNKDGVFKDTLTVKSGMHLLSDVRKTSIYNTIYLNNGYNLKVVADFTKWMNTVVFNGEGANENNAFFKGAKSIVDVNLELDEANFKSELDKAKKASLAIIEGKNLDPSFIEETKKQITGHYERLEKDRENLLYVAKLNNTPSPSFDYVNYLGGKSTLEDFKGKYIYIDLWATWCGPCLREVPHLKKIEELYHDKNIAFVSISVDNEKDYEKWKKMISDKALTGVQLFADKDFKSSFINHYRANSIPRFILIDPSGVIIASDAARPSDPLLKEKLDTVLN